MMITINIDKEEIPKPGEVNQSLEELKRWSSIRRMKDLPTGALDNAIKHMTGLHQLACVVYLAELNTPAPAKNPTQMEQYILAHVNDRDRDKEDLDNFALRGTVDSLLER